MRVAISQASESAPLEQNVLKKSLRKYHLNGEEKRQEVLKEKQLISANTDAWAIMIKARANNCLSLPKDKDQDERFQD